MTQGGRDVRRTQSNAEYAEYCYPLLKMRNGGNLLTDCIDLTIGSAVVDGLGRLYSH